MYPAIVIQAAGKIGPWLGRNSQIMSALVPRLRAAGAVVGETAASIVTWAKANPGNAAMLIATLASLGVTVSDWFGKDAPEDAESSAMIRQLDGVAQLSPGQRIEASKKIMAAGAASQASNLNFGDPVDRAVAIQVLAFASSFYGGQSVALRSHRLHQAFFEMPYEKVQEGFADLNLDATSVARASAQAPL